jgi:formate dehydrogenase
MAGDWDVAPMARHSFDLEVSESESDRLSTSVLILRLQGKVVGTVGAGRIGYRVLQRLMPFDCKVSLYLDWLAAS